MESAFPGAKEKLSILNSLWAGADLERARVVQHPFVLEMLAQTLSSASVASYINDQVQVFANVLSLPKNNRESGPVVQLPNYIQALRTAFSHLEIESKRVSEVLSSWGTSRQTSPAVEKMKQLIESNAASQNSSDELLTWTAILRLRDFLEKTISNRLRQPANGNSPCGVWLSTFAKSQFQACIALVEEELMKVLPASMNAAEIQQVQAIFNSVLQFELALLDSAYARNQTNLERSQQSSSPWHPSNIIFTTDFDVTCTIEDSSDALVRAAEAAAMMGSVEDFHPGKFLEDYEAILDRHSERTRKTMCILESSEQQSSSEAKLPQRLSGRDENSADLVPGMDPWLKPSFEIVKKSSAAASIEETRNCAPFNETGLRKALTKLSDLEVLCNQDVISAGVLGGSTREGIRKEAKQVPLRSNCPRVLQQLVEIGTAIHIVSANWSRDLISGGLPQLPKGKLFLHCNDLTFDDSGVSSGGIDMTVVDAFDKEQMLRALRLMYSSSRENQPNSLQTEKTSTQTVKSIELTERKAEKMMVYLGDSHTDLLGLLEADLGIVIGESPLVRQVMSLCGIQLLPLVEASAYLSLARLNGSEHSWRQSGILFEAQGWADVEACLFGQFDPAPDSGSASSATGISSSPAETPKEISEDQSTQQQPRFDVNNNTSAERLPTPMNLELLQVAC